MERYNRVSKTLDTEIKPKIITFFSSWVELKNTLKLHYPARHPLRRRTEELFRQMTKIRNAYSEDVEQIAKDKEDEESEEDDGEESEEDSGNESEEYEEDEEYRPRRDRERNDLIQSLLVTKHTGRGR